MSMTDEEATRLTNDQIDRVRYGVHRYIAGLTDAGNTPTWPDVAADLSTESEGEFLGERVKRFVYGDYQRKPKGAQGEPKRIFTRPDPDLIGAAARFLDRADIRILSVEELTSGYVSSARLAARSLDEFLWAPNPEGSRPALDWLAGKYHGTLGDTGYQSVLRIFFESGEGYLAAEERLVESPDKSARAPQFSDGFAVSASGNQVIVCLKSRDFGIPSMYVLTALLGDEAAPHRLAMLRVSETGILPAESPAKAVYDQLEPHMVHFERVVDGDDEPQSIGNALAEPFRLTGEQIREILTREGKRTMKRGKRRSFFGDVQATSVADGSDLDRREHARKLLSDANQLRRLLVAGKLKEFATWLGSHPASAFVQDPILGTTILHHVARMGDRAAYRILRDSGIDVDYLVEDRQGRRASEISFVYGKDVVLARVMEQQERAQNEMITGEQSSGAQR